MQHYPLAKPSITSAEERAVLAVLRSGNLSLGPVHRLFEAAFAKRIGTKYAAAVSSGTAGLHLAMIAAGIKPGDEVITSPFSFIASANSILYVGGKPVFVDIDPVTYNLDPKLIERAITKKTKAILVVHIFGQACDMRPIMRIAKKHKLKVIEDACESLLATNRGKPVGTFGESAVFAFYPNKQITTGEGGMLVTNSKATYELGCSLRNQGRAPNMQWLDHQQLGYNYRMDELSAALGLEQLKRVNQLIAGRKKIAGWYHRHLAPYADRIQRPETGPNSTHTWFVYVVRLTKKGLKRDNIIRALQQQGIASKPYLPSIHLFSFYKNRFGYRKGDYPISEQISNTSLALPFYLGLTEKDVSFISKTLASLL